VERTPSDSESSVPPCFSRRLRCHLHDTPGKPSRMLLICFWNTLGALEISKGSLLNQKPKNGAIKVVRCLQLEVRGICQNPLLASSFEKILAPASCAMVYMRHWVDFTKNIVILQLHINTYM